MAKLSDFCTCVHHSCPHHPLNHENGCTPCIAKNLRQGEIPECFFNAVCDPEKRTGDKYADFARAVMAKEEA